MIRKLLASVLAASLLLLSAGVAPYRAFAEVIVGNSGTPVAGGQIVLISPQGLSAAAGSVTGQPGSVSGNLRRQPLSHFRRGAVKLTSSPREAGRGEGEGKRAVAPSALQESLGAPVVILQEGLKEVAARPETGAGALLRFWEGLKRPGNGVAPYIKEGPGSPLGIARELAGELARANSVSYSRDLLQRMAALVRENPQHAPLHALVAGAMIGDMRRAGDISYSQSVVAQLSALAAATPFLETRRSIAAGLLDELTHVNEISYSGAILGALQQIGRDNSDREIQNTVVTGVLADMARATSVDYSLRAADVAEDVARRSNHRSVKETAIALLMAEVRRNGNVNYSERLLDSVKRISETLQRAGNGIAPGLARLPARLQNPADHYPDAYQAAARIAKRLGAAPEKVLFLKANGSMQPLTMSWAFEFGVPGNAGVLDQIVVTFKRNALGGWDQTEALYKGVVAGETEPGLTPKHLAPGYFSRGSRTSPDTALMYAQKRLKGFAAKAFTLSLFTEPVSGDLDLHYTFYADNGSVVRVNARTADATVVRGPPAQKRASLLARLRGLFSPARPGNGVAPSGRPAALDLRLTRVAMPEGSEWGGTVDVLEVDAIPSGSSVRYAPKPEDALLFRKVSGAVEAMLSDFVAQNSGLLSRLFGKEEMIRNIADEFRRAMNQGRRPAFEVYRETPQGREYLRGPDGESVAAALWSLLQTRYGVSEGELSRYLEIQRGLRSGGAAKGLSRRFDALGAMQAPAVDELAAFRHVLHALTIRAQLRMGSSKSAKEMAEGIAAEARELRDFFDLPDDPAARQAVEDLRLFLFKFEVGVTMFVLKRYPQAPAFRQKVTELLGALQNAADTSKTREELLTRLDGVLVMDPTFGPGTRRVGNGVAPASEQDKRETALLFHAARLPALLGALAGAAAGAWAGFSGGVLGGVAGWTLGLAGAAALGVGGAFLGGMIGWKIGFGKDIPGVFIFMIGIVAGLIGGGWLGLVAGAAGGVAAGHAGGIAGAAAGGLGLAATAGVAAGIAGAALDVKRHPQNYPKLLRDAAEAARKDRPGNGVAPSEEAELYPVVFFESAQNSLTGLRKAAVKPSADIQTPDQFAAYMKEEVGKQRSWIAIGSEDMDDPLEVRTRQAVSDRFLPIIEKAIDAARVGTVSEYSAKLVATLDRMLTVLQTSDAIQPALKGLEEIVASIQAAPRPAAPAQTSPEPFPYQLRYSLWVDDGDRDRVRDALKEHLPELRALLQSRWDAVKGEPQRVSLEVTYTKFSYPDLGWSSELRFSLDVKHGNTLLGMLQAVRTRSLAGSSDSLDLTVIRDEANSPSRPGNGVAPASEDGARGRGALMAVVNAVAFLFSIPARVVAKTTDVVSRATSLRPDWAAMLSAFSLMGIGGGLFLLHAVSAGVAAAIALTGGLFAGYAQRILEDRGRQEIRDRLDAAVAKHRLELLSIPGVIVVRSRVFNAGTDEESYAVVVEVTRLDAANDAAIPHRIEGFKVLRKIVPAPSSVRTGNGVAPAAAAPRKGLTAVEVIGKILAVGLALVPAALGHFFLAGTLAQVLMAQSAPIALFALAPKTKSPWLLGLPGAAGLGIAAALAVSGAYGVALLALVNAIGMMRYAYLTSKRDDASYREEERGLVTFFSALLNAGGLAAYMAFSGLGAGAALLGPAVTFFILAVNKVFDFNIKILTSWGVGFAKGAAVGGASALTQMGRFWEPGTRDKGGRMPWTVVFGYLPMALYAVVEGMALLVAAFVGALVFGLIAGFEQAAKDTWPDSYAHRVFAHWRAGLGDFVARSVYGTAGDPTDSERIFKTAAGLWANANGATALLGAGMIGFGRLLQGAVWALSGAIGLVGAGLGALLEAVKTPAPEFEAEPGEPHRDHPPASNSPAVTEFGKYLALLVSAAPYALGYFLAGPAPLLATSLIASSAALGLSAILANRDSVVVRLVLPALAASGVALAVTDPATITGAGVAIGLAALADLVGLANLERQSSARDDHPDKQAVKAAVYFSTLTLALSPGLLLITPFAGLPAAAVSTGILALVGGFKFKGLFWDGLTEGFGDGLGEAVGGALERTIWWHDLLKFWKGGSWVAVLGALPVFAFYAVEGVAGFLVGLASAILWAPLKALEKGFESSAQGGTIHGFLSRFNAFLATSVKKGGELPSEPVFGVVRALLGHANILTVPLGLTVLLVGQALQLVGSALGAAVGVVGGLFAGLAKGQGGTTPRPGNGVMGGSVVGFSLMLGAGLLLAGSVSGVALGLKASLATAGILFGGGVAAAFVLHGLDARYDAFTRWRSGLALGILALISDVSAVAGLVGLIVAGLRSLF